MKQTDKDKTIEGRYRQFAGCDTLKASAKLSMMRDAGLLEMKGKGKATYYVPGDRFAVGLMDADGRECDPYAIPPGFIATTIAIHLGKRIA